MTTTLRLLLLEQAVPPQLDFLLHALDSLRPAGDDLVVIDEVLVETRRVFAEVRRVLAQTPLQLRDPVAPVTRRQLRGRLLEAIELLALLHEKRRQGVIARRRDAIRNKHLQKMEQSLSPHRFAFVE